MNIKELNVIGFGKFNNKRINLLNGINIIYGENEAGKTTIHNFIDGMFYGFLKPYVKNTIYLEEHEKYTPWNNSNYNGIIKFQYFQENYIIERNFTKTQESTRVLLDSTGEDITFGIDTGSNGRILQPGFHFFGFNNAVYMNTVSIKQLGLRTDNKLASELREKLVNVTSALDDNISVEKSINEINRAIKSIGTIKAPTSVYSKEYNNLIQLQEEKQEILSYKKVYEDLLQESTQMENNINIYKSKLKEVNSRIINSNIIEIRNLYNEAKILNDEIHILEFKAKDYKMFDSISMDDYTKCISINNNLENTDKKLEELMSILNNLDKEINNLGMENKEQINLDENIQIDYNYFEELEDINSNLLQTDIFNKLEFIKRDYKSNKSLKSGINILMVFSGLFLLTALGFSFTNKKQVYLIFGIVLLFILVTTYLKGRKLQKDLKILEFEKNKLEIWDKENKIKIIENEKVMKDILQRHNITKKLEFNRLKEDISIKVFKKDLVEKELAKTIEKSLSLQEDLEFYNNAKLLYNDELKEILQANNSINIEDFKTSLDKKGIFREITGKIRSKKDLYTRILGNSKLEDMLNKLEDWGDYSNLEEVLTRTELERKMTDLQDELTTSKINKKGIDSNLDNINIKISNWVNIEEEIKRVISKIKDMDNKREALELAKTTIEDLSKDIHKQFAPAINQRVGKIIEQITSGKYSNVKIDNKLEIGVSNPITGEIVNINSLSGGTIDQLYFALRFGIIKSMADNKLPLILDDCFIQYDDIRLENILKFLEDTSKDRQIILFTCQRREMELLDKMGTNYNLIML